MCVVCRSSTGFPSIELLFEYIGQNNLENIIIYKSNSGNFRYITYDKNNLYDILRLNFEIIEIRREN